VLRQAIHALVAEHGVLQGILLLHSLCMQTQTHTHQQRHHAVLDLLGGQNSEALRLVVHAVAHEWNIPQRALVVLRLEAEVALDHDHDRRVGKDVVFSNHGDVLVEERELPLRF